MTKPSSVFKCLMRACVGLVLFSAASARCATSDGSLRMEVITAYNLVVDSNIGTPAGRGPTAAHLGVRIFNTGTTPITDVRVCIGDLLNPGTFSGTAGVYPVTTVPVGQRLYSGSFSFKHEGGVTDATRLVPLIPAGGSAVVYWLVSYPVKDANGVSVAGAGSDPSDDLRLDFDVWVEGLENGATLRRVYDERSMFCRSELTAMANKIWPNTTSKVPNEYLDAFNAQLGWRPNATSTRTVGADIIEGIWYDFGTVRQGFDNNGDLVPDYNGWMQPVGDPLAYDAASFRLVKSYGVLIITLNDGTERLIPFEDQLYFENIPDNNVGVVGLVYYEFVSLRQGATGRLSPYQEVASGYDNEKFNGDYGASLGSWESRSINVVMDKNAPAVTNAGSSITYDMTAYNTGTLEIGNPSLGLPLVVTDYVPSGLVYVANSAISDNTLPAGMTAAVLYTTNGTTWVATEPTPASSVIGVQWWLSTSLKTNASVTVRFSATVPVSYAGVFVKNCADVSLGGNESLSSDCDTTIIQGVNAVSGKVFEDDGSGGYFSNGVWDSGDPSETGISSVLLKLYLDQNTNGVVDSADLLINTQDSASSTGDYSFTKLPDGRYIVAVDPLDPNVTEFYALTTPALRAVDLDSAKATTNAVNVTNQNFGFAPPLSLDKSGGAIVYEGQEVTYQVTLKNNLYSLGAESYTNLFWVPSNGIQRINLSLSNAVSVSTATGSTNPNWGIYVDRTRNRIYWCDQVLDRIWVDDLLATTTAGATTFISGLDNPGYVAIDHSAPNGKHYMWWSANGKLQRVDLGLAVPVVEDRYTTLSTVSCGIAIDEVNRWIYFIGKPSTSPGAKYTIFRQSLDGAAGSRDTTWSVQLSGGEIYDLDIDVGTQRLYFVDRGGGVKFANVSITGQSYATSFNVSNGEDVRGLAVDVPRDRVYFSDSVSSDIDVCVLSTGSVVGTLTTGSNPGDVDLEYGAGTGTFDVNTTIGTLKVVDTYPSNLLSFVRASITPDSVTPAGTLTWNNLGPLNGGDTIDFTVTFKALSISGNSTVDLTNTAAVTQALLVNGDPVNKPSDTAPTTILPSGSIAGRIWADTDSDGWQPAQTAPGATFPSYGYEAGESGIGGVRVRLEVDNNNDGTMDWALTNLTDATGNYLFSGLATNVRYRVLVLTNSLPGTGITATGDPDDDGVNAGNGGTGSADSTWSTTTGWYNLGINPWRDASGTTQKWDIVNVNFGYAGTDPIIYGLVWLDLDRDGVRDANEPGIGGATVALTGSASASLITSADGLYTFRTNSAGAALVTGAYTVTITPPAGTNWITTFESATNAFGVSNSNSSWNGVLSFSVTSAAETSGSWDLGLIFEGTRKIGDTVYFDTDVNGVQGTNEVGIAGVNMRLYLDVNANGALDISDFLLATNVTDSSGTYLFTNLASAAYFVVANESDIPAGFRQTADPDQPGIVATLGDGMGVVALGTNDILTVDFGYAPQGVGQIGDTVFYDTNLNGRQDAGEGGISNVTVRLYYDRDGNGSYETLLASAQTDSIGKYLFSSLVDGAYRAVVDTGDPDIPATYTPSTSSANTLTLSGGVTALFDGFTTATDRSLDADFGFAGRPYIGDFVFYDANRNGTQDSGEVGIPNVTLRLYTDPNGDGNVSDGVLLAVTNTATGAGAYPVGYYQFPNLVTGIYYVVQVATNTLPVWDGAPIPQTADPDRDGVAVWDNSYAGLPAGDNADSGIILGLMPYLGADFGYQPMGVIGDTVWRDLNANGIQDTGETGISGVTVVATHGSTNVTAVTDSDGTYLFSNLANGAWTVYLAATNYVSGGPLFGWTDTYDPDGGLDHSTSVVINNGTVSSTYNTWTTRANASLDVDFGLRLDGSFTLSGTVLNDDAGTVGIYDVPALETELAGLYVYLYGTNSVRLGATQTDTNGFYRFTNLPAGDYRVVLGTEDPPLDTARLTTTAAATSVNALTNTGTSVIQYLTLVGNKAGVDFAFVPTVLFDYGDLPAAYGATVFATDGARHAIPTNGSSFYLGTVAPDSDSDGQPSGFASGDDWMDGSDDEDGVTPVNIGSWADGAGGGSVQVTVRAPAGRTAYLVGWIDFNQNGSLADSGELIVSAALTGTGSPASGVYVFDIPAGTMSTTNRAWLARFRVFSEAPAFPTFAYTGQSTDGEVEDHLFTENAAALGDRVWLDFNGNGVQDAGEAGITNVTVRLYNATNSEVASTVTDTNGMYRFDNLPSGSYSVGFTAPTPYVFTLKNAGAATEATDSDAAPLTGRTDAIALQAGATNLTLDAGVYVPALLYGYVFKDNNASLVRDTGDATITNVLVRLVVNGSLFASTNTSSTGYYRFENIPVGAVSVLVSKADATLIAVPAVPPASTDEMRNRALAETAGTDAYINYAVTSGYGVLSENPAEHLNFGFATYPFSTAIDLRVSADGRGGTVIDLWTVNESGTGDIVVYAWMGKAWVEVGRVPSAEVEGEGSNRYTIRSGVLPPEGAYYFRIVDEAGHVHDSPAPVAVTVIALSAVRLDMETLELSFNTEYGCSYSVRVSDNLGAPADKWAAEYVSVLRNGVWAEYSNRPFMAGAGTQTRVRVPVNRQKAFYRIVLIPE